MSVIGTINPVSYSNNYGVNPSNSGGVSQSNNLQSRVTSGSSPFEQGSQGSGQGGGSQGQSSIFQNIVQALQKLIQSNPITSFINSAVQSVMSFFGGSNSGAGANASNSSSA